MNNLDAIDLKNNQLQMLPENIFNGLHNLQFIDLTNNQLQTLPPNIFNGLRDLETLWLDNNQLKTLPDTLFSALDKLQWLTLNNNQLQRLSKTIFRDLNNLEDLRLANNPFNPGFMPTLVTMIHSIPKLEFLNREDKDQALSTLLSSIPTLQELVAEFVMQNFQPEKLEELAVKNYTAFGLLSLPQDQKQAILKKVAAKHATQQTTQS